MLTSKISIAIDGPVAAGKGTVAKSLAEKLGILYVDTGAMYRALALFIKQHQLTWDQESQICQELAKQKPKVELRSPLASEKDGRLVTVFLNNFDVSWEIREEAISLGTSQITKYKCVRDYMVPQQQNMAKNYSVVMEGRDITTRVLPKANLKIYLDASVEERVQRRYTQLLHRGEKISLNQVGQDLKKRDYEDKNRKIDPLIIAKDAWILDTTNLEVSQVIQKICDKLKEKGINKL